jgi:hypothetical protein
MFPRLDDQSVRIRVDGMDRESRLVFVDQRLVAILLERHPSEGLEAAPGWRLDMGFGRISDGAPEAFASLDAARAWILAAVMGPPRPDEPRS